MRRALLILLIVGPSLCSAASAQVTKSGLISPEAARQAGLERMWFTQLNVDRSRGRVAGLHLHVSGSQAHTVFQIVAGGQRYAFSQRDRNAFGEEIGVDGAKQKAEEKLAAVKKELEDAGQSVPESLKVETYVVPETTL